MFQKDVACAALQVSQSQYGIACISRTQGLFRLAVAEVERNFLLILNTLTKFGMNIPHARTFTASCNYKKPHWLGVQGVALR